MLMRGLGSPQSFMDMAGKDDYVEVRFSDEYIRRNDCWRLRRLPPIVADDLYYGVGPKEVRVIVELKQSKWELEKILLQLARYMRDAFTAQPTRRFVHGFFLHDTTMELWVFDRSGPYSSGEFDIHEEPEKFIQAIAGYAMMDDGRNGGSVMCDIAQSYQAGTRD